MMELSRALSVNEENTEEAEEYNNLVPRRIHRATIVGRRMPH